MAFAFARALDSGRWSLIKVFLVPARSLLWAIHIRHSQECLPPGMVGHIAFAGTLVVPGWLPVGDGITGRLRALWACRTKS
jgi:hypothetical protein